ncbi:hypothetical protein O181_050493 [Austropuccinia psidii MF-1]|uniref:Uncharacterized protein n=1 Tax=Austropuccinia psidii MF-1 TaxID=1389203 RepID=A0A9Q3E1V0_9BASI|nr:hypothetical protein [Austropuccinia psidii MF-1]
MEIAFWSEDKDIIYEIEGIPGYEMKDWDQLKMEMISKGGKVEPERRHTKGSLTRLFNQAQQKGGVKSLSQYSKFIEEYDIISKYLLKPKDPMIVKPMNEEEEVSIAQVEDWGNWEPPTVSSPIEMLGKNETIRQKKQRLAKKEIQIKEDSQSKNPILPGT